MIIPIETAFGTFNAIRPTLRILKELLPIVEQIQQSKKHSETIGLVEKALVLSYEGDLMDQVNLTEAMELIGLAIGGGKVSDPERKKSE